MANVDGYFLQPFKTHRKKLVPGTRISAKTKHHALNDGERLGRTTEGVAAIHVLADDETGEVTSLEVLARHGLKDEREGRNSSPVGAGVEVLKNESRGLNHPAP